jgi:Flp pilus assembly protein TadD
MPRRIGFLALAGLLFSSAVACARETWLKVEAPEATVITTLGARDGIRWATEFSQYITALREFFDLPRVELPALTIVVFAQEKDFQPYLPVRPGDRKPLPVGGFFARHEAWAVVGMPGRVKDETRRTIFHEGVHWFLSGTHTRNPLWLEEGLAEVFSTYQAENDSAEWGRPIEQHLKLLRGVALPPLEKLLRTQQSELFRDHQRTSLAYAQSWAFVHFLIFGQHDLPRNAIVRYLELTTAGKSSDDAFQQAFGRRPAEMEEKFRAYVQSGESSRTRQAVRATNPLAAVPATTPEVEQALGRLALVTNRSAQAMTHASLALVGASNDPRGRELLAMALQATGDQAGALTQFELAVAQGSKDFQPYFEIAADDHKRASARGKLTPAEARRIADGYAQAIQRYPRFRPAYENLASLFSIMETVSQRDRVAMELGAQLFPESAVIELGLAQLTYRAGDMAGARARLEHARTAGGLSPDVAQFAGRLALSWEFQEVAQRADALAREGKFVEARALLDERSRPTTDPALVAQLGVLRARLEQAQEIKLAIDQRRWADARRALNRLLESSAPPPVKEQARRTLADLDRRQLGVEPAKP